MTRAEMALLELKEMHITLRECCANLREIAQKTESNSLRSEIENIASYVADLADQLDSRISRLRVYMATEADYHNSRAAVSLQEWKHTLGILVFKLSKFIGYLLLLREGHEK
jgi:hypothetical protein